MTTRLVVIGAGGFGRETLDVVDAMNRAAESPVFELVGVIDDSPSTASRQRLIDRGTAYLGTVAQWLASEDDAQYLVAVGDPASRQGLSRRFEARGRRPASATHPVAQIGSITEIGPGSIICGGAQVSTNVHLGSYVHLNPNVTVGHDTVLANYVSVNPSATVSGQCTIGERAMLGAACVVLQGLAIGADAVVGASACVVEDVPAGRVVMGVPAR